MLDGNVKNNFRKLPINNINMPICNKTLTIQSQPLFLMFLYNKKNKDPNTNNNTKFTIIVSD